MVTSLEIAQEFLARGWTPIPSPYRTKSPILDGWGNLRIDATSAPEYFNGDQQNVGVLLGAVSGGLVDADLDSAEAIAVAPYLLPRTPALFGRAGKRASHRLYVSDLHRTIDQASLMFRAPDRSVLLELRIGGGDLAAQTVFPGSVHPSGEDIRWEQDGSPAAVDGAELLQRTRWVAACALLARHWPAEGGRHDAASMFGGLLARAGFQDLQIKLLTEAVARAAGDREWKDRTATAEDAAQHYRRGGHAYGFPTLVELAGEAAAERIAEWIGFDSGAERVAAPAAPTPEAPIAPTLEAWDAGTDVTVPPPRAWLLGTMFARRFVSMLLGPGASGKSALRLAQYLSLATGRSLTGEHVFQRARVLIVSLEDGADELRRRVLAACLHHGIERAELTGWLYLATPSGSAGKLMALDAKGRPVRGALAASLEATIVAHQINLVSVDPFVRSHQIPENDNTGIDQVIQLLTNLAEAHSVGIDLVHHVKKGGGEAGDADRGRGASAAVAAARLVFTLNAMTPDEAEALGIGEDVRRSFVRLDPGKVNLAPSIKASWFRLVGVPLGNATEAYPHGDVVQTIESWVPPATWADLTIEDINIMLDRINDGLGDGRLYSDAGPARERAAWRVVQLHTGKAEAQCREIIRGWVKSGTLARIMHEAQRFCGDCGVKRPIHVANRCSDELPRASTLRHSRHDQRYAASFRPASGSPQEAHS